MTTNKMLRIAFILTIIACTIPSATATWADSSYMYRAVMPEITDTYRPLQIPITISNSIGTNNATHIFCNGHCQSDFDDIRFYLDNTTLLPHYFESNVSNVVWVNVTDTGSLSMYYGNVLATSVSNGNTTFPLFDHFVGAALDTTKWRAVGTITNTFSNSNITILAGSGGGGATGYISSLKQFNASHSIRLKHHDYKLSESYVVMAEYGFLTSYGTNNSIITTLTINQFYIKNCNLGSCTSSSGYAGDTSWHIIDFNRSSNIVRQTIDGATTLTNTLNIPTADLNVTAGRYWSDANYRGSKQDIDYIFAYRYGIPSTWGVQEGFLITGNWNNFTNNDDVEFDLTATTHIFFNVTNSTSVNAFAWYLNDVNQSINANGTGLTISAAGVNNITIFAFNCTNVSKLTWFVTLPFTLLTPANGTTLYKPYPPLTTEVNFSWNSVGYPYYEILIAETSDFSVIVSDTYNTSTNTNISLKAGNYWWKVRSYNAVTGTWGAYSSPFNFTLTNNISQSGNTGIYGVVYEIINGQQIPISGATVYISNSTSTWSSFQVVGSNGYYLFDNLASNTTYYLSAKATGYDNSVTEYVTTGNKTWTQKDIKMTV